MSYKKIAGLIPTIQATKLVSHNLKAKKQMKTKDITELGLTNIVGVSMIKINADMIAGI